MLRNQIKKNQKSKITKYIASKPLSNHHTKSMVDLEQVNITSEKVIYPNYQTNDLNQTKQLNNTSLSKILSYLSKSNRNKLNNEKKQFNQLSKDSYIYKKVDRVGSVGKNNDKSIQITNQNANTDNYSLMMRLKQYIESLKKRQQQYLQKIQKLQKQNTKLLKKCHMLTQQIKNKHIKQAQHEQKLKYQTSVACHKHQITIRSLKKVIDQQIEKIIELEKQKILNAPKQQQFSLKQHHLQDYFQKSSESSNDWPICQKNNCFETSFCQTPVSHQANNSYNKEMLKSQGRDILSEVDNYIKNWIKK